MSRRLEASLGPLRDQTRSIEDRLGRVQLTLDQMSRQQKERDSNSNLNRDMVLLVVLVVMIQVKLMILFEQGHCVNTFLSNTRISHTKCKKQIDTEFQLSGSIHLNSFQFSNFLQMNGTFVNCPFRWCARFSKQFFLLADRLEIITRDEIISLKSMVIKGNAGSKSEHNN